MENNEPPVNQGTPEGSLEPSLTYEETPIIEPVQETPATSVDHEEVLPLSYDANDGKEKKKTDVMGIIKVVFLFVILFLVGFWVSGVVRQYLNSPKKTTATPTPTPVLSALQSSPSSEMITPVPTGTFATWKIYQVLEASTRQAYPNVSFRLPTEILAPVCDGSSCASQGTYLPGGTRFTVALRGKGQALPDYRGKLISDIGGKTFTTQEVKINGNAATEFTGSFTGGTVGGYAFAQMHGYMIDVGNQVSLEINHFTPSGIKADFTSDDALFSDIVTTIIAPGMQTSVGTTSTTSSSMKITPTVTPISSATVSSQTVETCKKDGTTSSMLYADAVGIAMKSDCATQGGLKTTHLCNSTTGTWWIDLNVAKAGCAPACVVDVVTKTATVNWRCTGLTQ